jgi:hypothetical protein
VTTITPWQGAFDSATNQLGDLTIVARRLYEVAAGRATATADQLDTLLARHVKGVDTINKILGAFTEPDEARAYFQRGGRLATDNPAGDVTVRNIDQLMAQITGARDPERTQTLFAALRAQERRLAPGARGPDSAGLGFPAHFHMPTVAKVVAAIRGELAAWTKQRIGPLPYVWDERLSEETQKLNVVRVGRGREVQVLSPAPAEVACRLVASMVDVGWKTVKAAVRQYRRAARPPTGCA